MTRYTVTWLQHALDQLAQLWIDHPQQRDVITAAAAEVDTELANDAEQKGTLTSTGRREMVFYPLLVLFAVREPDRIVEVARVHYVSFRSNGAPI
jgi:hypothetical protein